ncbi:MAG TPA: dienelactone hydrolase family protein [Candidatus Dormibacteraeota bacterium]
MCHPEIPEGQPIPEVRTREVTVASMPALLAEPEGEPKGAVLVINDIFGRVPFYENLTRRLAEAGFAALDPEYFFRVGRLAEQTREAAMARRSRLDHAQAVEDLNAALDHLSGQIGGGRLGTIGFCMGGTFVLQLAARRDDLASVCFYGFPAQLSAQERPRINGPLIGFWGDQDAGVGMENVEALDRELESRAVDHRFKVYPGLGHGFMKASGLEPDGEGYDQACEAWTQTLDFYREKIAPTPTLP